MDPQQTGQGEGAPEGRWDVSSGFTPAPSPQAPPEAYAQPLAQTPFIPQVSSEDDQYSTPGWSWAGFMWGPFFLIAIRKYKYLWVYLLPFFALLGITAVWGIFAAATPARGTSGGGVFAVIIPILMALCVLTFLVIPFYFGIKGRMLAAESKTFSNRDQYVGFMKVADRAGKVAFFVMLAQIALVGILFTVGLLGATDDRYEGSYIDDAAAVIMPFIDRS